MPLSFDERQLVVTGVHDATLDEVEVHFARFQRTDRRINLFSKLKEYVAALRSAQIRGALILDGSFIMPPVDQPEDIDIILVLPEDWDMSADLRPYQYNLVSKRQVKQEYRFDFIGVQKGSRDEQKWIDFFSQVKPEWCKVFGWPKNAIKGLVRILL